MAIKVKLNRNVSTYPMPVALVGTRNGGKINFMAVSWFSKVNAAPPMIAISSHKSHKTGTSVIKGGAFSLNIPPKAMASEADFCGMVSAENSDKSGVFDVFYGESGDCPMICGCPVSMECALVHHVALPSNHLLIAEVKAVYSEGKFLDDEGRPDLSKMKPFILSMPDNSYWTVGRRIGKAWSIGLECKGRKKD